MFEVHFPSLGRLPEAENTRLIGHECTSFDCSHMVPKPLVDAKIFN